MTEQTNLEDKIRDLIHQWEEIIREEPRHIDDAEFLKDLRDLLPDSPLPDPLFLAKATHPEYGEGIIASHYPPMCGDVRFMFPGDAFGDGTNSRWVSPSTLTFHTPDHPEFLETEEDYRSAPAGTIVADNDERPAVLVDELWRHIGLVGGSDHDDMAVIRRRVLRWGWGV